MELLNARVLVIEIGLATRRAVPPTTISTQSVSSRSALKESRYVPGGNWPISTSHVLSPSAVQKMVRVQAIPLSFRSVKCRVTVQVTRAPAVATVPRDLTGEDALIGIESMDRCLLKVCAPPPSSMSLILVAIFVVLQSGVQFPSSSG